MEISSGFQNEHFLKDDNIFTSAKEVTVCLHPCLFVCWFGWFVCKQDYTKSTGPIFMKLMERYSMGHGRTHYILKRIWLMGRGEIRHLALLEVCALLMAILGIYPGSIHSLYLWQQGPPKVRFLEDPTGHKKMNLALLYHMDEIEVKSTFFV